MERKAIVPFLKWPGGKGWMIEKYPELFPEIFDRYIEPFVGAGAVFFHLHPKIAILSDINTELIAAYGIIRDDFKELERELKKHHKSHCRDYYYYMRDKSCRSNITKAARFIYLNRTCWNGLYRVNLKGRFNVPIGTKTNVILPTDNFRDISKLLKKAKLMSKDFEKVISKARKGDLLFIDPPYTVKHNNNNFRKYNERIFNWEDQIRLRNSVAAAKKRGAKFLLCNADSRSIVNLYKGIGKMYRLQRFSSLAADSSKRQNTTELVIGNNI